MRTDLCFNVITSAPKRAYSAADIKDNSAQIRTTAGAPGGIAALLVRSESQETPPEKFDRELQDGVTSCLVGRWSTPYVIEQIEQVDEAFLVDSLHFHDMTQVGIINLGRNDVR